MSPSSPTRPWLVRVNTVLGVALCLFTAFEVNYPRLTPQSQMAIFAMLGLVLCFLNRPFHRRLREVAALRALDGVLAARSVLTSLYIVVQTEPAFERFWIGGQTLGNRAGQEAGLDVAVGVVGLLLVLDATRRSIGWALPILSITFIAYAFLGPYMPGFLFPHRGYGVERVVAQTYLQSQGVFGTALNVMFTYVFLFVVLGAFLKQTGATQFIIDLAQRLFGGTPGGPAKVSVVSSGLMGSLSGSAVANTATTGTFTIPMMRSSGFKASVAAGIEAAASSGGALVPPVMGAGAYMMLEIVEPPVTYLEIIKAAIVPAVLYYVSLLLIVHFNAKRIGAEGMPVDREGKTKASVVGWEGVVFVCGVLGLVALLLLGYTVFRAVTIAIVAVIVVSLFNARTRVTLGRGLEAVREASQDVIALVAASSCVGIVIGVVTLTGVGTKLPAAILNLSQGSLLAALVLIMISSIILGMGLPSAVCYLLMATLVGPVLSDLGVVPLSAHLFIFYFGMMSMVTPPVALAAYTAASIAGSNIMETGVAAFRFALVGFTLPYMFVFRPQLLMLNPDGSPASLFGILIATSIGLLGLVPFAAGIAGYLFSRARGWIRVAFFVSSALFLLPMPLLPRIPGTHAPISALFGVVLFGVTLALNWRASR